MTQADKGFTLVELLVALVIGAILFGIAVPNFRNLILQNRMSANANDFTFALSRARAEAVKLNASVIVCPSADPSATNPACANTNQWASGWIVFADTVTANQQYDETEPLFTIHDALKGDYKLVFTTGSGKSYVRFGPQGLPAEGTFGSFFMADGSLGSNPDQVRTVCLSITGKAKVVKGSACAD